MRARHERPLLLHEHTRVLGGTVEAIAAEKAGIMKPGVPVVVGPRAPHALLRARSCTRALAHIGGNALALFAGKLCM